MLRELNKALVVKNLLISNRKPVNIIYLNDISPKSLGELISLYEHKVFILGQLYGINSYDQWGVEIGKMRANNYLKKLNKSFHFKFAVQLPSQCVQ